MPTARVGLGFAAVILGAALFVHPALSTHVIGYAAATLFAFTLAGTARRASLMLAAETAKPEDPHFVVYVRVVLVLGFVVGVAHAWPVALELSKRWG